MNVISQRRVGGYVVVAVAALVAVLVVSTLVEACRGPVVTPASPSAPTGSTSPSPFATIRPASPGESPTGSLVPGASGASPSPESSAGGVPSLPMPSRQPGVDGPDPTIHIPPPIR